MLTIYLDKSNIIKLQLQSGRGAANLANVTKIVIKIDDIEIDSSQEENEVYEYITWLDRTPTLNEPNLFLKLGKHPSLQCYEGFREMRITVFDDVNINGLVWVDQQPIKLITELDQDPIGSCVPPIDQNGNPIPISDEKVAIILGGPAGYLWGTDGTDGVIRVVNPLIMTKSEDNDYIEISLSNNIIDDNVPISNGDMTFYLTDDETLTIKVKGSDGIIRSANITLS